MAAIAYPVSTRGGPYGRGTSGVPPRRLVRAVPPLGSAGAGRPRRSAVAAPHLRLVEPDLRLVGPATLAPVVDDVRESQWSAVRQAAVPQRRLRFLPALLTVAVLVAVWFGAGALSASRPVRLIPPAGADAVRGGFRYVARPGDTVWSIATAMDPGADPRPLVDRLDAELHGGVLRVGTVLYLP